MFIYDLFYSYGYDPEIDKALIIDLIDIIAKNPSSVVPDLTFSVTTYDEINGSEIAIDSSQIIIPLLNTPGAL